MSDPTSPALVDIISDWLGKSGLRKIWGVRQMNWPFGPNDETVSIGSIFYRETEIPYFNIWVHHVDDKGDHKRSADVYDPEFFEKLRKMLDDREASQTIICRCPQCEGTKL